MCHNEKMSYCVPISNCDMIFLKLIILHEQKKKPVISAKNESVTILLEEKLHKLSSCEDINYWINNISCSWCEWVTILCQYIIAYIKVAPMLFFISFD